MRTVLEAATLASDVSGTRATINVHDAPADMIEAAARLEGAKRTTHRSSYRPDMEWDTVDLDLVAFHGVWRKVASGVES